MPPRRTLLSLPKIALELLFVFISSMLLYGSAHDIALMTGLIDGYGKQIAFSGMIIGSPVLLAILLISGFLAQRAWKEKRVNGTTFSAPVRAVTSLRILVYGLTFIISLGELFLTIPFSVLAVMNR